MSDFANTAEMPAPEPLAQRVAREAPERLTKTVDERASLRKSIDSLRARLRALAEEEAALKRLLGGTRKRTRKAKTDA